ncbi:MAG TPA: hypothetical protein VKU19_17295 [Bryobacteraceae bacterium]|nr:hypothetical protein [Bryobacteraceae bacterium]
MRTLFTFSRLQAATLAAFLITAGGLLAQQVAAPTPENTSPPRGEDVGNYNFSQTFEFGYRFKSVGGDEGMYRSVDNYGNGLRLLGSNLSINSKDGHGTYFDEILLNTIGLGNDNYQAAILRIQKNNVYRYDMTWRLNAYYNPGLTTAGGAHLEDTIRRIQDHNLLLLPQSKIRFNLGYSRNTEDGPALSTAQEFDTNGSAYPVFTNVKRQWNEYRLGADLDLSGFKLTILRRWDFFKDDTPASSAGIFAAGTPTDATVLQQFQRSQPVHGSSPGWLGNLFTRRKHWGINSRITYVSGRNDFALDESAAGISSFGTVGSRQITVGGEAKRPDLAGDFTVSLFPTDNLTLSNTSSVTSNRIDGNSSYSEINPTTNLGTTIYFQYLGILTLTNSTDVDYRVKKWLGFYGGYHYSDRHIRTIDGSDVPAFANSFGAFQFDVSNHVNSGTFGVRIRPISPLTINLDGEVARAYHPLTPISDKNYHAINGRIQYRLRKVQLSTSYRQVYNLNPPLSFSNFSSHSRQYSANASYAPLNWFSIDASYTKIHLDTFDGLTFFAALPGNRNTLTHASSEYISNIHAANLGVRWAFGRRADLYLGYTITKDTGDGRAVQVPPSVTDPLQVLLVSVQTFPLTYQSPLARVSIKITPKIRWNAAYQFYGYGEQFHILGYDQNYHAHTGYTSILWSF